jgi:hypothetical protein
MSEAAIHESIKAFRSGSCRNTEGALSHTYAEDADGELWPMCGYGWNRSDGQSFSILRGSYETEGDCKLCQRNLRSGKPPVKDGFPHKTRWL